jgi:hypothetical protein
MIDTNDNEIIISLIRLRKRCCGGVSAASMTTNTRMAKDNVEFQKLIQGVNALIAERDEARRTLCEKIAYCCDSSGRVPREIAEEMGWEYLKWTR